jgi:modulator of FtsH protease HflK
MNGENPNPITPPPPEDAGSQALADALRSSFVIVQIIMVVLIIAFLASGMFTVGQNQRAIVLRLGKPVGEGDKALLMPGFHPGLPSPIDEVVRIPFTSLQTAESSVGWYLTPEERAQHVPPPPPMNGIDPATMTYALTSDTNILHVKATVRYKITNPVRYYFDFTDAAAFVTNALDNALLFAASQFPVDDILTRNRTGFLEAVTVRVQKLVDEEHLGVTLETPLGLEVSPPLYLVEKFNAVDTANVKRDNARAQAETYATTTLAEARTTAASHTNDAQAARVRLVTMLDAQAQKFTNVIHGPYAHDHDFYLRFMQMTLLESVYKHVQEIILEPHVSPRELRVNLNREPSGPATNSVAP